jgi:ATP-dependent RNA helicase RhlE
MKDQTLTTFSELGLDPALLKAIQASGYETPTPIQVQSIPHVLAGKDIMGIAQTGTGKTAAFALPILHRLKHEPRNAPRQGARALVLSPTRELATQIAQSFKAYGQHLGISVAVMFGGVGHRPQINAVRNGVDVLVATPGRLLDHLSERHVNLAGTEILVLDEADQMLDMGFIRPIRQILSKLSPRRQSLFFSATMAPDISVLANEMLREPVKVQVTPVAKTADRVEQKVIFVEAARKRSLLVELFSDITLTRTLVFTRTKRGADKVAKHLQANGISVAAIHGNKSQGQRESALRDFRASKIRALVATDIAARGIDIDEVSHVVNYELPNIPESYVHRIGRTARAGAEGIAISFCDGEERAYLRDIERLTRQQIKSEDRRGDTALEATAEVRAAGGRRPERQDGRRRDGQRANGAPASRERQNGRGADGHRRPHDPRVAEARSGANPGRRAPEQRSGEARNANRGEDRRGSNGSNGSNGNNGNGLGNVRFLSERNGKAKPFRHREDEKRRDRREHTGAGARSGKRSYPQPQRQGLSDERY